jgi:hypothetical protein
MLCKHIKHWDFLAAVYSYTNWPHSSENIDYSFIRSSFFISSASLSFFLSSFFSYPSPALFPSIISFFSCFFFGSFSFLSLPSSLFPLFLLSFEPLFYYFFNCSTLSFLPPFFLSLFDPTFHSIFFPSSSFWFFLCFFLLFFLLAPLSSCPSLCRCSFSEVMKGSDANSRSAS